VRAIAQSARVSGGSTGATPAYGKYPGPGAEVHDVFARHPVGSEPAQAQAGGGMLPSAQERRTNKYTRLVSVEWFIGQRARDS
jgi:hypothetical protein